MYMNNKSVIYLFNENAHVHFFLLLPRLAVVILCKSDSFTVISKKLELELPLPPQKKQQKKLGPQGLYLFAFV